MIVVGGSNSAIDKLADVDRIAPGAVIRMRHVRPLAGGKGLHVALACATLGHPVTLVGLADETTRGSFEHALPAPHARFVGIDAGAPIRTCLALRDEAGLTTELLEPGPEILPATAEALVDAFTREAVSARCAALSGSLPPGMRTDTYARSSRRPGARRWRSTRAARRWHSASLPLRCSRSRTGRRLRTCSAAPS